LGTPYNNFVHFTPRSFVFTLAWIAALTLPLWLFKSRQPKTPDLSGEWTGTIHVSEHISGIGKSEPMNLDGTIYLKLEVYDSIADRYRGSGELRFPGSGIRKISIREISFNHAQRPDVSGMLTGDLEQAGDAAFSDAGRTIQGTAAADANIPGYVITADLHRGSRTEYNSHQQ
jgi:hypothetical protein